MRLHQLKVDYDAEQDRLVMLVATNEGVELRLALTRRFVKLLWPLLVKLAEEASPRIRTQANPEARKALLGLEHEHAVSKADFSKPYDAVGSTTPLGETPLLLARIQTGHDRNGQPVVALHPARGPGHHADVRFGAAALGLPPAAGGGEEKRLGHGAQAARQPSRRKAPSASRAP